MDMTIYDLASCQLDKFINQDTDLYGRVVETYTHEDTVDLLINIKTVAVDDHHIIIEFPNNAICAIPVDSFNYHKIEVM